MVDEIEPSFSDTDESSDSCGEEALSDVLLPVAKSSDAVARTVSWVAESAASEDIQNDLSSESESVLPTSVNPEPESVILQGESASCEALPSDSVGNVLSSNSVGSPIKCQSQSELG